MATGRDIYAITAPLIVEATVRIAEGMIKKKGVVAAAEVFEGCRTEMPEFQLNK
jgi:hypothetical protein